MNRRTFIKAVLCITAVGATPIVGHAHRELRLFDANILTVSGLSPKARVIIRDYNSWEVYHDTIATAPEMQFAVPKSVTYIDVLVHPELPSKAMMGTVKLESEGAAITFRELKDDWYK